MRYLLKTDGTVKHFGAPQSIREISALIGAETCDSVPLRSLHDPLYVMVLNDAGWESEVKVDGNTTTLLPIKALLPINAKATEIYQAERPGTTHQIAGDVFICPDSDFAIEPETEGPDGD